MSSMRNAAPRRPHRERAQPQARSKWGLLEKHKDYSLRAADYNQKKKKLGVLSQKSQERNPDEFAFGMLAADKGQAGRHGRGDRLKNQLDHGVVEKLKAQDAGYLRTVLGRTRKELAKVTEEMGMDDVLKRRGLGLLDEENRRKVTFGEDGQPEKKRRKIESNDVEMMIASDMSDDEVLESTSENRIEDDDGDKHGKIPKDDVEVQKQTTSGLITENSSHIAISDHSESENARPKTKTKKQVLAETDALKRQKLANRRRKKIRDARANKLEILKRRQKSIMAAASELELQRAKMARTIGGANKNGVKFKVRERKR